MTRPAPTTAPPGLPPCAYPCPQHTPISPSSLHRAARNRSLPPCAVAGGGCTHRQIIATVHALPPPRGAPARRTGVYPPGVRRPPRLGADLEPGPEPVVPHGAPLPMTGGPGGGGGIRPNRQFGAMGFSIRTDSLARRYFYSKSGAVSWEAVMARGRATYVLVRLCYVVGAAAHRGTPAPRRLCTYRNRGTGT